MAHPDWLQRLRLGTPAACAALSGHEHCLRVVHELGLGETLSQPSPKGKTPAHWAAQKGHAAIVATLIKAGAALDLQSSDGDTAVMLAAQNGYPVVVAALIKAGVKMSWHSQLRVYQKVAYVTGRIRPISQL